MREKLIDAAEGRISPDIVFKNCRVADVFRHRFWACDVAVIGGRIAGLGSYSGEHEVECGGAYLLPSFIDAHMHIESSTLCPDEYAKVVAPHGVTALIADPHEIANVSGETGLNFMLARAKGLPVDIHYMMPSCVPATDFERSGAMIDSENAKRLLATGNYLGLGEMMNYPGVVGKNPWVMKKLAAAQIVDGHAPAVTGKDLCAYAAAGVLTDHECATAQELLERVSLGMYVMIREGTQTRNLEELVKGVDSSTVRRLLFCTDDRYLGDNIRYGSIENCINKAVGLGVDFFDALTMASLNAAECYRLGKLGAVAPGWQADLVLCDSIQPLKIRRVYKAGKLIAEDGRALFEGDKSVAGPTGTVHLPKIDAGTFSLAFNPDMPVMQVMAGSVVTKAVRRESADGLCRVAVIERHKNTGLIGQCFAEGFGLKDGAIAQSVGHDSHNVSVLGDNAADMAAAVNALGKDGGMAVVRGGKLTGFMALPVSGLMTDLPAAEALAQHEALDRAVAELETAPGIDPFMLLSFIALPVIPDIKLTCEGLFDVTKFEFIK